MSTVASTESTPPLYYVVAWAWTRAFGDGEVALRSLSALAGVATVPLTYLGGAKLLGRRTGLAAAALVTVSPPLVWYSQEARSYALATFMCAASFVAFVSALRAPAGRNVVLWAAASVLAIGTHYFAVFVVGGEAAWLLASFPLRRSVRRAVAAVVAAALLVSPLALEQRGNGFVEFIGASGGLAKRSVVLVKQILVGHSLPADRAVAALVAAIVSVSVALLVTRATRAEQRAAAIAATTGGAAVVVPVLLAAVGLDYVNTRNALVGFAPLAVASCAGLALAAPRRASAAALAALFAVLLTITVVVAIDPAYHRPDWRSLAQAIGTPHGPRAVVVAPDHQGWFARVPLRVYLADAHGVDERLVSTPPQFASVSRGVGDHQSPSSLVVDEIVVAAAGWETPALPRVLAQQFRLVEVRSGAGYELRRYRSAHPIRVPTALFSTPLSAVLLEKASP